jgi:hypothetical protein
MSEEIDKEFLKLIKDHLNNNLHVHALVETINQ